MRILFLQIKGKSYGGVWQVNKLVGEALVKDGYDVDIVSIRENKTDYQEDYDKRINVLTLNKIDVWETYTYNEILYELKHFKLKTFLYKLRHRINNNKTLKEDKIRLSKYLNKTHPDYIVTSHYQILDMLPKEYLTKVYHQNHSNFRDAINHKATRKTYLKYKDKIKFIWLSKKTMDEAKEYGILNSTYIYNSSRIETKKQADVINNKKIVTVARLSKEKRIDLMIETLNEIFKDIKYKDWTFEIYGDGGEYNYLKSLIKSKQIKLMGRVNDTENIFLNSSINLNASVNEGFGLSIIEGYECGVPIVSFNYGDPAFEVIKDNETGFIAIDKNDYKEKIKKLMDDKELLKKMSNNTKKFNQKFHIKTIIKEWEKLFNLT